MKLPEVFNQILAIQILEISFNSITVFWCLELIKVSTSKSSLCWDTNSNQDMGNHISDISHLTRYFILRLTFPLDWQVKMFTIDINNMSNNSIKSFIK